MNAAAGSVSIKICMPKMELSTRWMQLVCLDNLDEMLRRDEHESFRKILETKVGSSYLFVSYLLGENTTEVYKKTLSGS